MKFDIECERESDGRWLAEALQHHRLHPNSCMSQWPSSKLRRA